MFSASQTDTFLACERKWGWRYLDGIKLPPHPSAQLGSVVHAEIERYYRDGAPLEADGIAMSGYHLMPARGPDVVGIEAKFETVIGGHAFIGYKDLRFADPPTVYDWKTTANLQYAKSDLIADVQGAIYAYDELTRHPSLDFVHLVWVYMQTKGKRKAVAVTAIANRDNIAPTIATIEAAADRMAEHLRAGRRALNLTPNETHCDAYGGCPYRERCFPMTMNTNVNPPPYLAGLTAAVGAAPAPSAAPAAPVGGAELGGGWYMGFDGVPTQTKPVPPAPPVVEVPTAAPAPEPAAEAPKAKRGRPAKVSDSDDAELGAAVRVLLRAFRDL